MACDTPEHYAEHMDAFQFIKDVPVDWSESRYLYAEPQDYLIIARKDKNSDNWYLGGVTDEQVREFKIPCNFLEKGKKYTATIYKDAPDADYLTNPKAYTIERRTVKAGSTIKVKMAAGGGFAVSFEAQ